MKTMLFYTILFILIQIIINDPVCIELQNNCLKCNPINNLCLECCKDIFTPNKNGGCDYYKNCIYGKNYCEECNHEENICQKCQEGYIPDEFGGCSYTNNCYISYRGECLECKEDYILIGQNDGVRLCKPLTSEDFKNCIKIDSIKGKCSKCKEGYFLNESDKKCCSTQYCEESIYDICQKCIYGYYLDRKANECKKKTEFFKHCKETNDGQTCFACDDYYYFDENNFCTQVNYCSQSENEYVCEKCISGYYLTEYGESCTPEINCHYGSKPLGICTVCKENYYIDVSDGKCKSNIENDEFKYCYKANKKCTECIGPYHIDKENMCTTTNHCVYSENQICLECDENYYLGLDKNCIDVENCIYSIDGSCLECKAHFYYNRRNNTCLPAEGNFENCKTGYDDWICTECRNDFYLNQTDSTCYSNEEEGDLYKCAITSIEEDVCSSCIEGYYLGTKDNRCTKVEGCAISENENKCIECDENYCLNIKTGTCHVNDKVIEEENKFYYKCNETNSEGNACEVCLNDYYDLNDEGLCIDNINCEETVNADCIKCQSGFCLNKDFGCVESFYGNCLECHNTLDFDICSKCIEGYELNNYNVCIESKSDY